MRVTKLHIYGFGRFQDKQIDLSKEAIHVFLGENEAGKSTIMAFIRSILFGFPSKQSTEQRYEPKLGGRYGGSIELETEPFGKVKIERVHGKSAGNVKIYFQDGKIGDELLLKNVLHEMDRTIFTGIYSFGLSDLQQLDQVNSEELNKFMYGVGISGRHHLLEIERKNEKAVQLLFKPSGKKPIINEQLQKVRELDEKAQSFQKKAAQYNQLVIERNESKLLLEESYQSQQEIHKKVRYLEKLQSLQPIIIQKKTAETRLAQLPLFEPFPEDGSQRLEKLKEMVTSLEAELQTYLKKAAEINEKKSILKVDHLRELEEKIGEIKEYRKLYETKRDEVALLTQELQFEVGEYELLLEKLGVADIVFDTSYRVEQKLARFVEEEALLKQQHLVVQSQWEQAKTALEAKEEEIERLKTKILPQQSRKQLEQKVSDIPSEKEVKLTLQSVEDQMQLVKKQLDYFQKTKSNKSIIGLFLVLLASLIASFFLFEELQMVFIAFLLGAIFLVFLVKNHLSTKTAIQSLKREKQQLIAKREDLQEQLKNNSDTDTQHSIFVLKEDQAIQEQLLLKKQQLLDITNHYEQLCKQLDKWEWNNATLQEELTNLAESLQYPQGLEAAEYMNFLKLVEEGKKKQRHIQFLKEKRIKIDKDVTEFEEKVAQTCALTGNSYSTCLEAVERLSIFLKEAQEKEQAYQRFIVEEKEQQEKVRKANSKIDQLKQEIEKLFHLANCQDEEQFRHKGRSWKEAEQILLDLRVYQSQLVPMLDRMTSIEQLEQDCLQYNDHLDDGLKQLNEQLKHLRKEEKTIVEKIAHLNYQINELEDGTTYSNSLHNLEIEKGILNDEVKKWAFFRTVQLLIAESKKLYEKERQPFVIKEATKMFEFLTHGEYSQLFAPIGEEKLYVERFDGVRFQPNELSQGTKEQLYLAIRWALARVHSKKTRFPLFIDDIFVNFDERRRQKGIELMKEISKDHQIIFFTCHSFIASEISEQQFSL